MLVAEETMALRSGKPDSMSLKESPMELTLPG